MVPATSCGQCGLEHFGIHPARIEGHGVCPRCCVCCVACDVSLKGVYYCPDHGPFWTAVVGGHELRQWCPHNATNCCGKQTACGQSSRRMGIGQEGEEKL